MQCPRCKKDDLHVARDGSKIFCTRCNFDEYFEWYLDRILRGCKVRQVEAENYTQVTSSRTTFRIWLDDVGHSGEFYFNLNNWPMTLHVKTDEPHLARPVVEKIRTGFAQYLGVVKYVQTGPASVPHGATCPSCGAPEKDIVAYTNAPWEMTCCRCRNYEVQFAFFVAEKLAAKGFFTEIDGCNVKVSKILPKKFLFIFPVKEVVLSAVFKRHRKGEYEYKDDALVIEVISTGVPHPDTLEVGRLIEANMRPKMSFLAVEF